MSNRIVVIATTISGSIKDWGKVKYILPLFKKYGETDVVLHAVDSHQKAREKACEAVKSGSRIIIAAGGSGTFNRILEGCCDSGVDLNEVRLGFLRKGSADLIGKTLGMPDDVMESIPLFVKAIRRDNTISCDILHIETGNGTQPRNFVGYGGAEVIGHVPYFSENPLIKYYKGILGQLFGDWGPFFVAVNLAILKKIFKIRKHYWTITIDGEEKASGYYQAMLIINGRLGDLPYGRDIPLGSGDFFLGVFKDIGKRHIYRQFYHTWKGDLLSDPGRSGFEIFRVTKSLVLKPDSDMVFPVNVDGSAMPCTRSATITLAGKIKLLSGNIELQC